MYLVLLISSILFTLFCTHTCAGLEGPSSSPVIKVVENVSEAGSFLPLDSGKKDSTSNDDHAGDHDKDDKSQISKSSVVARKGVTLDNDTSSEKEYDSHLQVSIGDISNDRASTTVTKTSAVKSTSDLFTSTKSKLKADLDQSSTGSDKYSAYDTKSTRTDTSSSVKGNTTASSNYSKSADSSNYSKSADSSNYSKASATISASTESVSSSKHSKNKKPLITYSVEDDPTLLNVPITRQIIVPLTPTNTTLEAENPPYLPPFIDSVPDRMQNKGEKYIFPLVVLIFLVPMILGVGIIILRRVRDYWQTRHYRRMDFLVDGMYNT